VWVFEQLAELDAGGVFREERNPLYRLRLPADAGRELLESLRDTDPDTGELELTFEADPRDTRFLGDLYEQLAKSAGIKDKYSLVQTPASSASSSSITPVTRRSTNLAPMKSG